MLKNLNDVLLAISILIVSSTYSYAGNLIDESEGFTKLMRVIETGEIEEVKKMVKQGVPINTVTIHGFSPLAVAASRGHKDIVIFLLNNGAKVNEKDDESWALKQSFLNKTTSGILLEYGANPNTRMSKNKYEGSSVLARLAHLSMYGFEKNSPLVRRLLKYGADPSDAISYFNSNWEARGQSYTEGLAELHFKVLKILKDGQNYKRRVSKDNLGLNTLANILYIDRFIRLSQEGQNIQKVLRRFNKSELNILKNAIFAGKGYSFTSSKLDKYFRRNFKSYRPTKKNIHLSYIERKNVEFLKGYERKKFR